MPVFSFEKLPRSRSALGRKMKSTGEALGLAERRRRRTQGLCLHKDGDSEAGGGRCASSIADHDKREAPELAETFAALPALRFTRRRARRTGSTTTMSARSPCRAPGEDTDKLAVVRFRQDPPDYRHADPWLRPGCARGFRLRRMAVEYGIACGRASTRRSC